MLLIFIPPSSSSTWRHPIHSTERALFSRMDEHKHMLFLPGKSHIIRNQNYSRYYRQWVRNAYISRPSPRTISSRRRFILGISKPVGSSHYDDAARWKMRGTDDFLLHEEKILPSDADRVVAEHDSRRKKPLSCRGDSDFCAHLPRGVKIFALPTNSVACISYVWV